MLRRFLVLGAGLFALTAVAALPAAAQYGPDVEASRPAVQRNQPFVLSGSGFPGGVELTLTLVPASAGCAGTSGGLSLGSTRSHADGTFSSQVAIPASAPPGSYLACARHLDAVAQTAVEVLGAEASAPASPGGGSAAPALPRTGSDTVGYGALGAGLVALGGLILLGLRRRLPGDGGAGSAS